MSRLTPTVELEGDTHILLTPQLASVPTSVQKKPVGSLAHMRSEIIASLVFAIAGI